MDNVLFFLCLVFGLLSALVAGVFQTFSDFVMAALARAQPAAGIESMQQINRTVYRSVFLYSFLALVPLSIAFSVYVAARVDGPARLLVVAATAVYLIAVFLVTVLGNVPMNQRLDRYDPFDAASITYWRTYCRDWTRWNHVRTAGAAASAAGFLAAAATQVAG